jgi:hypothetical protein
MPVKNRFFSCLGCCSRPGTTFFPHRAICQFICPYRPLQAVQAVVLGHLFLITCLWLCHPVLTTNQPLASCRFHLLFSDTCRTYCTLLYINVSVFVVWFSDTYSGWGGDCVDVRLASGILSSASKGAYFSTERQGCREYWMIYRRPGFLAVVWFGSSPTPFFPLPSVR